MVMERSSTCPTSGSRRISGGPSTATAARTPLPAGSTDRGVWIAEFRSSSEEGSTVKITLIGKLGKTIEKPDFTLAMLKHTPRLNALPKGIPRTDAKETSYVVYIGGKQWHKVKDALQNPQDVAIIEGTPMWDPDYEALGIFTTSITTKLTQQAKREQQQAQAHVYYPEAQPKRCTAALLLDVDPVHLALVARKAPFSRPLEPYMSMPVPI
jgi:hypothetical protein